MGGGEAIKNRGWDDFDGVQQALHFASEGLWLLR